MNEERTSIAKCLCSVWIMSRKNVFFLHVRDTPMRLAVLWNQRSVLSMLCLTFWCTSFAIAQTEERTNKKKQIQKIPTLWFIRRTECNESKISNGKCLIIFHSLTIAQSDCTEIFPLVHSSVRFNFTVSGNVPNFSRTLIQFPETECGIIKLHSVRSFLKECQ